MTDTAHRFRVSVALALAGFLLATVAITAAVSPPVLAALHGVGADGATLEEVTLRILELSAIALTFPLLALLGGGGRAAWGVPRTPGGASEVAGKVGVGVLIGVASLLPVCAVLFVLDVRVAHPELVADLAWWLKITLRAALAAVVVALLEELWFRGGLFTVLMRCAGRVGALWIGAVVYAGAHFLDAPDSVAAGGSGVMHTLSILGHAVAAVFELKNLDSFGALLVAGLALGLVRLRLGHVALAVGIHAGWVLTIKVFKKYTYVDSESPLRYLVGHYDGFIGLVGIASLGVLLFVVWWRVRPRMEQV